MLEARLVLVLVVGDEADDSQALQRLLEQTDSAAVERVSSALSLGHDFVLLSQLTLFLDVNDRVLFLDIDDRVLLLDWTLGESLLLVDLEDSIDDRRRACRE